MQPDYSKSVLELYRDLVLKMIQCDESIEVVCAVQHDPTSTELDKSWPSWVPRWDRFYGCRMLGRYTDKHFAGGNSRAVVHPSDNTNVLKVQGLLFDSIPCHSKLLKTHDFNITPMATSLPPGGLHPVMQLWKVSGCADTELTYPRLDFPSDDSLKSAYAYTLTGGYLVQPEGHDILNPLADFSAYWLRLYETALDEDKATELDRSYLLGLRQAAADSDWERFREAAAEACHRRKFFFTEMGYFGLGPGATSVDDKVAVLFGADTPFVLRRVGDEGS